MNQEFIDKVLQVSGDFVKNLDHTIPGLVTEVTHYFIFLATLEVIRNLFFFSLVLMFYRFIENQILYLQTEQKNFKNEQIQIGLTQQISILKILKILGSLLASAGILNASYPSVETIGKALWAPRIFILEKAKEFKK